MTFVSLASAGLVVCAVGFALFAARRDDWSAWAEPLLACIALAVVLLSPVRLGPVISLASILGFFLLDLAARGLSHGLPPEDVVLAFLLLGSLLAASYVRLGLRRRETELAIARETIGELTRGDRISELLAGNRELTWLETEISRSRRHHHQLALVLIRPDGLDPTTVDAAAAIELLTAVADVIGRELRASDVALRHDPTTFALVMPETSTDGARVAAERIRLLLPQRFPDATATTSAGVATFPRDAATNDELVQIASRALQRARALGGNRTVCASVEDGAPAGWALAGAE